MTQAFLAHWWRIATFRHRGEGLEHCSKPLLFVLLGINIGLALIVFSVFNKPTDTFVASIDVMTHHTVLGLFLVLLAAPPLAAGAFIAQIGLHAVLAVFRAFDLLHELEPFLSLWMLVATFYFVYRSVRRSIEEQRKSR